MKTFAIFATLLSLAFASQELLQCMDQRAADAGNQATWEADHAGSIETCEDKQDVNVDPQDACDPKDQMNSAALAHQHEACIFEAFGWINATGSLDLEQIFADFSADEKFRTQLEGSMARCMKKAVDEEVAKVEKMHAEYVKKCHPEDTLTQAQKDAQKSQMTESLKYGAEATCAFLEMANECPEMKAQMEAAKNA